MNGEPRPSGVRRLVVDDRGHEVRLTEERWAHIADSHPEVSTLEAEVCRTVREPTFEAPSPNEGDRWLYLDVSETSVAPWLKVVVRYEGEEGWVVTAFLRRSLP